MFNKLVVIIFLAFGIGTYIFTEVKRLRHKIFAFFVILLLLFIFFSTNYVYQNKNVKLDSFSDIVSAAGIYFSWLENAFFNLKEITGNAIKMDWSANSTKSKK